MPALPLSSIPPLTAAQYADLPELEGRYELQEGAIVVAGSPVPDHQHGVFMLALQLQEQTASSLRTLIAVDIDLELVPESEPGTVRVPDLVVITEASFLRVRNEGGLLRAADVQLAVEILSRSTRRTDSMIKRAEYADAGIGHYWMIDLQDGPSLAGCHLSGEFGYVDDPPVRGMFSTADPFAARIDLARLR
jgi:Uma2 family endonuclease